MLARWGGKYSRGDPDGIGKFQKSVSIISYKCLQLYYVRPSGLFISVFPFDALHIYQPYISSVCGFLKKRERNLKQRIKEIVLMDGRCFELVHAAVILASLETACVCVCVDSR